jgi:TonB family protein
MEYIREHKRGLIGTIIFHVIVLILLILFGFITPLPLPGEEGILVNFGDSETGLGDIEPSPAESEAAPVQPVQQEEKEEIAPPPVTTPPKPQPKSAAAKEAVMTQDLEKTAAIDAAENKKKADEKKRKDLLEEQRRAEAREAERIKNEEAEKIRKAEADRIAKAEAERKAKEEQQRKISEINSRAQGAFASKGNGSGGKGTGEGKSQGVTFPGGNQGVPTGDPNSNNYGQGGSGNGNKGSGPSFSLEGRSATSLPKPKYPGDDEGVVVVKITVDKTGTVTSAEPGARGTTIMDQQFWAEAKQAALKAKFNEVKDNSAAASQQGTITYKFVLD